MAFARARSRVRVAPWTRVNARRRPSERTKTRRRAHDDDDEGNERAKTSVEALDEVLGTAGDARATPSALDVARANATTRGISTTTTTTKKKGENTTTTTENAKRVDVEKEEEKRREARAAGALAAALGARGALASAIAFSFGISAFGDVSAVSVNDVVVGLACATPVCALDAVVAGGRWSERATRASEVERDDVRMFDRVLEPYVEGLAKYEVEEAMGNPCKSQPWWNDIGAAFVSRVADEMLERAVALTLGAKWIADRACEAGVEPYDAKVPSEVAVVVLALVALEFRLKRARSASRVRAFRVERNKVTGKQTLVPLSEDELNAERDSNGIGAWFSGAKKSEPAENGVAEGAKTQKSPQKSPPTSKSELKAFRNLVRGKSLKDTLDGSRSRLLLLTQSISFMATGSIVAPVVGGFAADVLYVVHQRQTMARFVERALGEKVVGPPKDEVIRRAQVASFKATLQRKKKRMSREVLAAMDRDTSITRDVNILFQDVVRRTKKVKNIDETTALDEVLIHVNKAVPQGIETSEGSTYVAKMTAALKELDSALDAIEEQGKKADVDPTIADDGD